MNTKTTLIMAVALAILGGIYFLSQQSAETDAFITSLETAPDSTSASSKELQEKQLGEIVKVVCHRKGHEAWTFEKEAGASPGSQGDWYLTSPERMKCVSWEVNKFNTYLGRLDYEISYKPGDAGGVTAEQAGLDPPEATVTMTDADGESVSIDIGHPAPNRGTYVRLAGSEEICLGKSDLSNLLKDSVLDYREKVLWNFRADKVTRVEITDRTDLAAPVSYVFSKDDARWMMESPVTARASGKVTEMLATMARMTVIGWQDSDASRLAIYGLDPGQVSVLVTVEEEVATDGTGDAEMDEDVDSPPSPPEIKTSTYELHVSQRSPLGEETKTYIRVGDEHTVATIMKSNADRFRPVLSEWRDPNLMATTASSATRVELSASGAADTVLVKSDGAWRFDPDGGRAEESAVVALLTAVDGISGVAFLDNVDETRLAAYGLASPRAELRLTIPGVEGVERISIGDYTDPATRRLVYVRRNDLTTVAKVRAADVQTLIEPPLIYRDRAVLDVLPSRFTEITLGSKNGFIDGRREVRLTRENNEWRMTAPVDADVQAKVVDKLVESLGGLLAKRVVAESGEASAFGLHDPKFRVSVSFTSQGGSGAIETVSLSVTSHEGRHFASRSDRATIYEVSADFVAQLGAELRIDRVVDFADDQVQSFSIREGTLTHGFTRDGDRWLYTAEKDLPLDAAKVKNLLLRIRDLRTPRYVVHSGADLAAFGLVEPSREVTVVLADGAKHELIISETSGDDGVERGYYAAVRGHGGVFLLQVDTLDRLRVSLDDLEATP